MEQMVFCWKNQAKKKLFLLKKKKCMLSDDHFKGATVSLTRKLLLVSSQVLRMRWGPAVLAKVDTGHHVPDTVPREGQSSHELCQDTLAIGLRDLLYM